MDANDSVRSAVYHGWVRHRRLTGRRRSFRYRLYMLYLDLDEVPSLFAGRWFWGYERRRLMSFRRRDYLGGQDAKANVLPLRDAVLDHVEAEIGHRPTGAVRVLTQVSCLGVSFNPVSFYYCFDADESLCAVVAEITNTPWNERHRYTVAAEGSALVRAEFGKRFHISPFLPLAQDYEWRLSVPDASRPLVVHMRNVEAGVPQFDATLRMEPRPWSGRALAGALLRHPLVTGKVVLGIYWQALRMWVARYRFHAHPSSVGQKVHHD